jgi:hypothetical protein
MRKIILFLLSIFILGCSSHNRNQDDKKSTTTLIYSISDFKGVWTKNINKNAEFEIRNDTMYLLEGKPVRFEVHRDTLITHYEGMITKDKILKLSTDSLILLNELGLKISLFKIK